MTPPIYFHPHILNQPGRKRTQENTHNLPMGKNLIISLSLLKGQKIMKSAQSLKVGLGPESQESSVLENTERIWAQNSSLIITVTILYKMGNPFLSSCRVLCWCYSSASTVWSGQIFQIIFYLSINPFPLRSDLDNVCQDSPVAAAAFGASVQDAGQPLPARAAGAPAQKSSTGWSQVISQKMGRALKRQRVLVYVSVKQLLF